MLILALCNLLLEGVWGEERQLQGDTGVQTKLMDLKGRGDIECYFACEWGSFQKKKKKKKKKEKTPREVFSLHVRPNTTDESCIWSHRRRTLSGWTSLKLSDFCISAGVLLEGLCLWLSVCVYLLPANLACYLAHLDQPNFLVHIYDCMSEVFLCLWCLQFFFFLFR